MNTKPVVLSSRTLEGARVLMQAMNNQSPHALARAMAEVDRRGLKQWGMPLSQEGHHQGPCGILPTGLVAWFAHQRMAAPPPLASADMIVDGGALLPWAPAPNFDELPEAFWGILAEVAVDANAAPEGPADCPCCEPGQRRPRVPLWALVKGDPDEALITDHIQGCCA